MNNVLIINKSFCLQLTVFTSFFVMMELPAKMKQDEMASFFIRVFNYEDYSLSVSYPFKHFQNLCSKYYSENVLW